MIEVKEILEDFEVIDIQSLATEYGITDEKASIAVSLYNKALNKMNIGSYDAARIDLRKSVNMYPSFVESRMLLGVCVFALGERTDAVAIFNTIKGDNRERALGYLDKLHELSTRPESASFRSSSRQARVPETAFADNKLDAIMKSADNQQNVSGVYVTKTAAVDSFDNDDDIDVAVENVNSEKLPEEDAEEKSVALDDSSEENDTIAAVTPVAPYSGMRRSQRRPVNENVATAVNSETDEKNEPVKKVPASAAKKEKSNNAELAKANRTISNLKIQKARVTIVAMGIGLLCAVLLIVVICLSVSNSNLESQLEAYKNGQNPSVNYNPNGNGGNTNPVPTDSQQSGGNENTGNNEPGDKTKAVAAYKNAKTLFETEKFVEAADLLVATDLSLLDAADRSDAETLYKNCVNKFTVDYNNKMLKSIEVPEDWNAVIEYGLPVYKHNIERNNPDFTGNAASVCFHLGKAYELTGDKEHAKEFYNITMNKFADNAYASYAKSRLSGIQ